MNTSQTFEEAVARLRDRFREEAEGRLNEFLDYMHAVEGGRDQTMALEGMIIQVHRVRGVAKTFGFADLGAVAQDLEEQLEADRKVLPADQTVHSARAKIDTFVTMMRGVAA